MSYSRAAIKHIWFVCLKRLEDCKLYCFRQFEEPMRSNNLDINHYSFCRKV